MKIFEIFICLPLTVGGTLFIFTSKFFKEIMKGEEFLPKFFICCLVVALGWGIKFLVGSIFSPQEKKKRASPKK